MEPSPFGQTSNYACECTGCGHTWHASSHTEYGILVDAGLECPHECPDKVLLTNRDAEAVYDGPPHHYD